MTTATSIIAAAAHSSTARLALLPGFSRASSSNRRTLSSSMRCALLPQRRVESRRSVSLSLVFLQFFSLSNAEAAFAAHIMDMSKRQYLEDDQPKFADFRNLLRSGPASPLRINIRAASFRISATARLLQS